VPFCGTKPSGLPKFEEAANYLKTAQRGLIFIVTEEPALLKILTTDAMSRPRNGVETLFRQGFTAMNTLSVTGRFDSLKRFIDQIEQLPIVVRHRHQQFLGISVRGHVSRILRRFRVALATVKLRRLNLTDETFTTVQ
jgi:hypothetical protein